MAVSFVSVLDNVGSFFKKIFSKVNPVITTVDNAVIKLAPVIDLIPGFGTMVESGANIVAQVEGAAASANAQTGTGATKLAIALPTVEQIVSSYAVANGLSVKSAASAATITSAIVTILNEFGPAQPSTAQTPIPTAQQYGNNAPPPVLSASVTTTS